MEKKHNNKNYIDKELYEEIMIAMKRSGVPDAVFELAKKMDMNLPKMFWDKILNSKNSNDILSFSRNLLGIYGNYFAALYYKERYVNVKTEMPLYGQDNKPCTNVDISFVDENGVLNLCEVKASPYIGIVDNYIDENGNIVNNNSGIEEMKKYKNIGEKLLTQINKLTEYPAKVNVVIFEGSVISDEIDKEIKKKNEELKDKNKTLEDEIISKKTMSITINQLESYVDNLIDTVIEKFNNKTKFNSRKI